MFKIVSQPDEIVPLLTKKEHETLLKILRERIWLDENRCKCDQLLAGFNKYCKIHNGEKPF